MSDFIEVTSLDIKVRKALVNINHISDIQEDDKGEVRIYLSDGATSYLIKEAFDEIVKKIKDAKHFSMSYPTNTSLYEEQTQNQGYTLV